VADIILLSVDLMAPPTSDYNFFKIYGISEKIKGIFLKNCKLNL
jgi:hypothetical protein